MAHTYLSAFRLLPPRNRLAQERIAAQLALAHGNARLVERFGVKPQDIAMRGSEIEGAFGDPAGSGLNAHRLLSGPLPMESRMHFFAERVRTRLDEFYAGESTPPDHLIHVTCTGYVAPSAAQRLVADNGWPTAVTHAYHMGCYGALPSVRIAHALAAAGRPGFRVDLVHTELCTLHFRFDQHTPEQLVVQTLFADGFARYSCTAAPNGERALRIDAIDEVIVPDTADAMTWLPGSEAMLMTLSRDVPRLVGRTLHPFLARLCRGSPWSLARVLSHGALAIHPGGPRILDMVRDTLEVDEDRMAHSRAVLREHGNMSSATLPHIWARILDSAPASGTPLLSLAFGPGLTVFGALFTVV